MENGSLFGKKIHPGSLLRTGIILFVCFQVFRAFSPPTLYDLTMKTAEPITLTNLVAHFDRYIDQPVVIEKVRVDNPIYLYFGSIYYMESLDKTTKVMVLSRQFPPKEGSIVNVFGAIQPVLSIKGVNLVFFRQAAVQKERTVHM